LLEHSLGKFSPTKVVSDWKIYGIDLHCSLKETKILDGYICGHFFVQNQICTNVLQVIHNYAKYLFLCCHNEESNEQSKVFSMYFIMHCKYFIFLNFFS